MIIDVKYRATTIATGGRDGWARTDDRKLDLKIVTPKELGGAGGEGTNPEQLFAMGYATCFLSAVKLAALRQHIAVPTETSISATVGIGLDRHGGFGLRVALVAELPGVAPDVVEQLTAAAHQICPYSKAIRNNIDVAFGIA